MKTLPHNKSPLILVFLISLLLVSCLQDKEIDDVVIDFPDPIEIQTVQLIGQLLSDDGSPASGAQIDVVSALLPGLNGSTNENGFFFFPEFTNIGQEIIVKVKQQEHYTALYSERLSGLEPVILTAQLTEKTSVANFLPENGVSVTVGNSLQLLVEPNSFEAHVGEIELSVRKVYHLNPDNYLREVNGRGFLNQSFKAVNVNQWLTLFIDFADEFGGNPDLIKDIQYSLQTDNSPVFEYSESVNSFNLQFPDFSWWMASEELKPEAGILKGRFDKSGIWTIGGAVQNSLSISGKLVAADKLLPIEGKIKLIGEDGIEEKVDRINSNGLFYFENIHPGKSFSLEFYNSCGESIHSYGPISVFESTELGQIIAYDQQLFELKVDARDCNGLVPINAYLQFLKNDGPVYFRSVSEEPIEFYLPVCGDDTGELSLLDGSGNLLKGPFQLDLKGDKKTIRDLYECFDRSINIDVSLLLLSTATADTVYSMDYTLLNPDHELVVEIKTDAIDNLESYRVRGKNDCIEFNIRINLESGKIFEILSQELEFFCFDFNYEYQQSKVGHTGFPAHYDGGEFINQVNIIDMKNLDNGETYDLLIEFRSYFDR